MSTRPLVPVAYKRQLGEVVLLDMNGIELREPFLVMSAKRAVADGRVPIAMPIAEWFASEQAGSDPLAFIFHVGRCGSSVVANMLSAHPDVTVVSESQVISALIRDWTDADPGEKPHALDALREGIRRATFSVSNGRPVIVKTVSWNLAAASEIATMFPATRMLFLTRAPTEVVASCLRKPPAWIGMRNNPSPVLFPSLAGSLPGSDAAFYAHAWGSAMVQASKLPTDRTLTVAYENLTADPAAMLDVILHHFQLEADTSEREAMTSTTSHYAKDPQPRRIWRPGSDATIDGGLAAEVDRIVSDISGS